MQFDYSRHLYKKENENNKFPRIEILYSDEDLIVINKEAGILSVPDRYDSKAIVALDFLEKKWGRLFVVHRIDKETSGLIVYCRNARAHKELSKQFESREVKKIYLALVVGKVTWDTISCDMALLADGDSLHRTIVDQVSGKKSYTEFSLIKSFKNFSFVEARPESGRIHQVRVHLAELGHPCVCDKLYGSPEALYLSNIKRKWKGEKLDEKALLSRTALHAFKIEFKQPSTGQSIKIEGPIPKDLLASIKQLEKISK